MTQGNRMRPTAHDGLRSCTSPFCFLVRPCFQPPNSHHFLPNNLSISAHPPMGSTAPWPRALGFLIPWEFILEGSPSCCTWMRNSTSLGSNSFLSSTSNHDSAPFDISVRMHKTWNLKLSTESSIPGNLWFLNKYS